MASNNILLTKLPASPWVLTSLERKPSATRRPATEHRGARVLPAVPVSTRASQASRRKRSDSESVPASLEGPAWVLLGLLPLTACTTDTRSTGDYWLRGTGDTSGTQTTTPITIPPTSVNMAAPSHPTVSGASVNVTLALQRGMGDARHLGKDSNQTSHLQFSVPANLYLTVRRETSTWFATLS